ncbi:MAG: hypothetical protein A3H98_13830 [Bacteroidetes bacterium RIFCSPLOWO2_02_FULL_36_8]|nr:MAG: hypothetical protein A3H98_13830 [Bacteroidetes bacterium RIFCSPLOWO2_02_FULL_36_8]OFY70978.1 MAG: hypothetical protein A3G23_12750 [Bacteroidetes bacterium RIFCSPLOWO2_12_FULL_37_12]
MFALLLPPMGIIQRQGITNTLIAYSGILVGFVNLLVLQPYLLTPEEVGLVRILYSVSLLFSSIFPVGISSFTLKYFPYFRNPEKGHHGFFWIITGATALLYILFSTVGYFFKDIIIEKYTEKSFLFTEYFNYVLPMGLFMGFIAVLTAYCFALFKPNFPSFLNELFNRLAFTILLSLYFLKLITIHSFIAGYVLIYGLQFIILTVFIYKNDRITVFPQWNFLKPYLNRQTFLFTSMFGFAGIASIGLKNVDVALLGGFVSLDKVAVYSIAVLIGTLIEIPSNVLNRITDGRISDALAKNDLNTVDKIYKDSVRYLTVVGGFLFLLLIVNLQNGLSFLPAEYRNGYWVTIIIASSSLINMSTGTNSSIIYFSKKYLYGIFLLLLLIVTTFLLNFWLIPNMEILGAAFATGISAFLFNVSKCLVIYRIFKFQPYNYHYLILVLFFSCALMLNFVLPVLDSVFLDLIYRNSSVLLLYIVGVFFSKLIPENLNIISRKTYP